MNSFDEHAQEWDQDKVHQERSAAVARCLRQMVPLKPSMKALEYGAGTGLLSFILQEQFAEITLMDNSREMLKICEEKAALVDKGKIHPVYLDLEQTDYPEKFDIIYSLMVLHHVRDTAVMLKKFYSLLNGGAYLAIADLYSEDGSFHGEQADVHKGFDPDLLSLKLQELGFKKCRSQSCYVIKKNNGRLYPVFLLVAQKPT